MSLAYIAAEYFADCISVSRDCKISVDHLNMLKNLIGKDIDNPKVAEYVDKKSKHDYLYIFKKFPDIFAIEENFISLSPAFSSLYNLNKFSVTKRFHTINCYVKNWAIEYFIKILKTQGPKPYPKLFEMLMTDQTQKYSKYFSDFSALDALNFFLFHRNYFTVIDNFVVILTTTGRTYFKSVGNYQEETEAFKIFEISVYFLLTCFDSLHYFYLKQCLSYVQTSTKHILEQISLVRQREVFAILPVVSMDAFGFVTLKNRDILVALPDFIKTILLLVCILAFKKEMYIVDLVAEFSNRMLPTINRFSDSTFADQIAFIKQYPMSFHLSETGHISLLPEFMLPECPFPQSSAYESCKQNVMRNITGTDQNPFFTDSSSARDVRLPNSFSISMPKSRSSTITSSSQQKQNSDSFLLPGLPEIVAERIKQSFFFLSKHFYPLNKKRGMQTLLHVVDDVRISFCSFSDKCKFITECCNFMNSLSDEYLEDTACSTNELLTEKEENLLFIIYILSDNKQIYFLKLIEAMEKHKIDNIHLKSTIPDQYKYFKTLSGYIEVFSDGTIIFPSTFSPIKSIIDSYSTLFSDFEHASTEIASQGEKPSSRKVILQDREPSYKKTSKDKKSFVPFENKNDKLSKTLDWVVDVVPLEQKRFFNASERISDDSAFINLPISIPDTICKTLSHCSKLLSKYYECAAAIHILKATLFSFADIYNYISSLKTMSERHAFAEECYKYLNKKEHHYSSPLSCNKREVLFITYLLLTSEDGRMHYRRIGIELNSCHCKGISVQSDRLQYWYFRRADKFFVIDSDGFVRLDSSFRYVDALVNVAINYTARSQSLLKSVHNSNDNPCKTGPEQAAMKNLMAAELPVGNENSKKLDKNGSQFEVSETSSERISVDVDTRNVITDVVFFFLSLCEKMSIEKLCYKLNSFNIEGVHNLFSSCTITEKLNFFKSLSPYLEVSNDGFLSLKKDAPKTLEPKTNINLFELFKRSKTESERSSSVSRSRSESVKSTDVSEVSVSIKSTSSKSGTKRRRRNYYGSRIITRGRIGSKKHESTHNKISYEVHKVTDKTKLPEPVKIFYNSSLGLQTNCAENSLKTVLPASKENRSNATKSTKKVDEKSESTSEIETIVKVNGIETGGLLTDADSHMNMDKVPEFSDKESEQKIVETESNPMISALEKSKSYAFSVSEAILKLKVPRQPVKECVSSKLSQSSSTLLEKTAGENNLDERDDCSVDIFNKMPLVNGHEPAACETVKVKSNLSNASAHLTELLTDTENVPSFKEIDQSLQACSMPVDDSFHNDLKNDSSFQAYISDLIDEFLYSAKTAPLGPETSSLNNEHKIACANNKHQIEMDSAAAQVENQSSQKVPDPQGNSFSNSTFELKSELQDLSESAKASETVPPQSSASVLKNCYKIPDVPNNVASFKPEHFTPQKDLDPVERTVIEDRAVTFFLLMLKNYQNYEESTSVDFLKSHISQASTEVQSFMFQHYGNDFAPFFLKHKKVFYVSPITRCVYLVRKSSQKLRVDLS